MQDIRIPFQKSLRKEIENLRIYLVNAGIARSTLSIECYCSAIRFYSSCRLYIRDTVLYDRQLSWICGNPIEFAFRERI